MSVNAFASLIIGDPAILIAIFYSYYTVQDKSTVVAPEKQFRGESEPPPPMPGLHVHVHAAMFPVYVVYVADDRLRTRVPPLDTSPVSIVRRLQPEFAGAEPLPISLKVNTSFC